MKTPVLESLFNKVAGLQAANTGDSNTGVFLLILQNFKNSIFYRIPLVATSEVHVKKPAALLNIYYFTHISRNCLGHRQFVTAV